MAEHYPITHPAVNPVENHITQYVPHYATCHTRIVATGKKGRAPGELNVPSGVAIHGETRQIFVATFANGSVEIFSETGEFLYQLGVGQLFRPWGIAAHGDSVYVSSRGDHTVSKFSLTIVRELPNTNVCMNHTQPINPFRMVAREELHLLG